MSTPLSLQTSNQSLDAITIALPHSLAANVRKSMVEQVFVWVVKDTDSANSIVTILESAGFTNIKVDSKGTTITAQSSATINNTLSATADSCSNTTAVSSCSGSGLTSATCKSPYYVSCVYNGCSGSGGYGCSWNGSLCSDGGCENCTQSCPTH
jgi:hypothetical protein